MAPVPTVRPRFLVDGVLSAELERDFESLLVHVDNVQASAEVVLRGPLPEIFAGGATLEPTLTIWLSPEAECFSGVLREFEARIRPEAGRTTVLFASGTSPDGSELPGVLLRFGEEVEWGSVRRGVPRATAHVQSGLPSLRWNSRVSLTTPDPSFDGQFQVAELWYRFDSSSGFKVEFIGQALS